MKLFDSHCHLDDRSFKPDFEAVMHRAAAAEVHRMLVAGIDRPTSQQAVGLANRHSGLFASVGVHPHDAHSCSEATLAHLRSLADDPKVVAWGEIGLDFNRMYSPQKDQERWLIRQLEMAEGLNLPLIFHERDSRGRLLEILNATPSVRRSAVVHCFSGTEAELEQYLKMGFYIGITGIVTISKRGEILTADGSIHSGGSAVDRDRCAISDTQPATQHVSAKRAGVCSSNSAEGRRGSR
jgi:TatD DNase family protein